MGQAIEWTMHKNLEFWYAALCNSYKVYPELKMQDKNSYFGVIAIWTQ